MELMDGKKLASEMEEGVAKEVEELSKLGVVPSLAVILVGSDPASQTYVGMKARACKRVGLISILHEMPSSVSQKDLLDMIKNLNNNDAIDGILVQLPLPPHLNVDEILEAILPSKDVDGFHPHNSGRLHSGLSGFVPATPLGIMSLLKHYKIDLRGKDVTLIGASRIVGRPLSALMLNSGATASLCHVDTRDVGLYTKNADLVCVAVGKPGLLTASMVKPGAIVVDVGVNRLENGRIVGDVAFEEVAPLCAYITPVPGGVGPMTIVSLLQNTLKSARARRGL